jgi:hypothetical protein
MSFSRRGFGFDGGFIDQFSSRLVTTYNYSAFTNLHTLQITRAHAKSYPACSVFTSSCLATAYNNVYSSASKLRSFLNGGSLPTELSQNQSQNYFTTGCLPPISRSLRQAP